MSQPPFDPAQPPPDAADPAPAPARSRRGLVAAVVGAVVLIVAGTGAVAAYQKLVPHGSQPDTVIPATAVAFTRIDLDPSAGQKIAATRFLGSLPQLSRSGGDVDPKKTLWDLLVSADPDLKGVDYATDVQPWLGDRAGLALLPGGTSGRPNVVIALQTTDQAKAKAGIEKVGATGGGSADLEVTAKDDYALVTPKGNGAAVLSDLAKGTLAGSATYTSDLAGLGDTGVMSAWVDSAAASKAVAALGGAAPTLPSTTSQAGRLAVALRFDAGYVELAGVGHGAAAPPTAGPTGGAASLPADTMVALQVGGLGEVVRSAYPQIEAAVPGGADALSSIEGQLGVSLPDDLVTLLGQSLTLSLAKQDPATLGGSTVPRIGAKIVSPDATKTDELVTRLTSSTGFDRLVKHQVGGGTVYLATTDDYLTTLRQTGTLGTSSPFTTAVADPTSASIVLYADLVPFRPLLTQDAPADARPLLSALTAVGVSGSQKANGDLSFSVRVVGG